MKIRKNVKLAPYTTFKIGGPAKFFCEAKDEGEISEALRFARENKLPVFILGGGSNVLVSDKGFDGLVIKILNTQYSILNTRLECGAGCQLGTVVNESVKAGLTGLEWAAGIPGTVGGAMRGNAGAYGSMMGEIVENIKVLQISNLQFPVPDKNPNVKIPMSKKIQNPKSKNIFILSNKDCQFNYRDSIFKHNLNLIILSVELKLKKGDKAKNRQKIKEILAARKEKQPMDFPSPGSFFKNPVVKNKKLIREFEIDTGQKIKDNKIPAPYLIERVGLKGKKIGGAMVSEKHANFIVNTGKATADNVATLVAIAKTRVRDKYGIQLEGEVQMVGF
jgi:UDP-N-acetylmuramate dehydrogenase